VPVLRDVLRNSSDVEHRAIADYIIGYAPKKRDVVADLQQAIQDPEDGVRNNAIRAMTAISVLAAQNPDLEIQISPTWFVEMLNSVLWTDRNKAVMALLNLTDSRQEKILALIRTRGAVASQRWLAGRAPDAIGRIPRCWAGGRNDEQTIRILANGNR
jgi:hypothetical protein